MNVNNDEINKFGSMANEWWDKDGPLKTLHQINPLRMSFIQSISSIDGKKIIDVGCGGGILSEALCASGANVLAVDLAQESIGVAKNHATKNNLSIDYQIKSVEQIALEQQEEFDIVTCMEMLEHVPSPESVIESCAKLVKQGGYVFLSTLNRTMSSYLLAIIAAEHILKIIPKNTHKYETFIKPYEIVSIAARFGLQPVVMKGMAYNPISKSFKLSDKVNVNYIICFKKG